MTTTAQPARAEAATITPPRTTTSIGLLILRIVAGAVFAAHGAQKVFEFTLPGTVEAFTAMGAPLPAVTGPAIALLELVGGALLILGVLTRPVALLLAADMVGAIALVHLPAGLWVDGGGVEFVAVLGAAALALAFTGAGSVSGDRLLLRGRLRRFA